MREDEHSSDQPEYFDAHKNDSEWKFIVGTVAFLAVTAIATILHNEKWKFQSAECPECQMVFLSKGYLYRHVSKNHKH